MKVEIDVPDSLSEYLTEDFKKDMKIYSYIPFILNDILSFGGTTSALNVSKQETMLSYGIIGFDYNKKNQTPEYKKALETVKEKIKEARSK